MFDIIYSKVKWEATSLRELEGQGNVVCARGGRVRASPQLLCALLEANFRAAKQEQVSLPLFSLAVDYAWNVSLELDSCHGCSRTNEAV